MERTAQKTLLEWKSSTPRKPLLVSGARQTGKTWLLKDFGRRSYEQLIYCNFEEDTNLHAFFKTNIEPGNILAQIATYRNISIRPGKDLIVFDEVQLCNPALNSLKYFQEEAPQYHLIAAGSLLGIKLSQSGSFPVGKVSFLDLYPMTFSEFLNAAGESRLAQTIASVESIEPFVVPFHDRLVSLLRTYYVVGGMPEAVSTYCATGDFSATRTVQANILRSYVQDFVKHAPRPDIPRLTEVWESVPKHLARENKKFIFSAVTPGARARTYETALAWLGDTGLVNRCFAVDHVEQPLSGCQDRQAFKVYALDVGLLGAMAGLEPRTVTLGDELFTTFNGAFVENFVAQHLRTRKPPDNLYYWKNRAGLAEVDFLVNGPAGIVPVEVKAGINPKSKSLTAYADRFHPRLLVRTTLLNLKKDGRILNIPLYAVEMLDRYVEILAENPSSGL